MYYGNLIRFPDQLIGSKFLYSSLWIISITFYQVHTFVQNKLKNIFLLQSYDKLLQ